MKYLSAIIISLILISSCEKPQNEKENVAINCSTNPEVCDISTANNRFGIDLFSELHRLDQASNIFISPTSLGTALSMTANGAKTQTLEEMKSSLHIDQMSMDYLNTGYKSLLQTYPDMDRKVILNLANSIWPKIGYQFKQSFLDINKNNYLSEVNPVDFNKDATRVRVNDWIEDNTEGLIKEALKDPLNDVIMLLINTIYFKASWKTEFDPEDTYTTDFYSEDNKPIAQVEMMQLSEQSFPYMENELFQMVDLPYGDSIYSMTVLLPQEDHTVNDIIKELNTDNWENWLANLNNQEVKLHFPRFKMEYNKKLKDQLITLGMVRAFGSTADFSGMSDGQLFIDQVIHQSYVEVNEEGTEAAAVTIVIIKENAVGQIPVFNSNKPFLFMIRERNTGSILFMGKMMNPVQ